MKKLLIALMLVAIVLPALAEEKSSFKFSGAAYTYGATMNTVKKDETKSFASYRFRPYFSYLTENVKATVKFEIDQFLGKRSSSDGADIGNDEKGVLEIKAAYLMFQIPVIKGLSIKGGVDEYKTPGGLIVGTEVPLGLLSYKIDKHAFNFLYAKVEEKETDLASDDVTFYGIDVTLGFGDMKIRPALYITSYGKASGGFDKTSTRIIPSLGFSMKMDALSLEINGSYGTGSYKSSGVKTTLSGYAVDVAPTYEVQKGIKVGAFFTMLSGDKTDTTDKKENFSNFNLKHDGHGRMFLLENTRTFNNMSDDEFADVRKQAASNGYMLFGATAAAKINTVSLKVNLGYGQLAQAAAIKKKDLGFEADLSLGYEIKKNAKIILDFAYLATGKAFGQEGVIYSSTEKQASVYAALGMIVKF